MKEKKTEVVFILDKSGSMHPLEQDTINGYNSFLNKQREVEGECYITTILFSDRSKSLYQHQNINNVNQLTREEYSTGGCTALLDSLGYAINDMKDYLKSIKEERDVLFVIITDGMENASREYSYNIIKRMISEQQERDHWNFTFLGANIDAVQTASDLGIHKANAANYHNDQQGVETNFACVSHMVKAFRAQGFVQEQWKEEIDKDFQKR